jgi:hypothetical protein
VWVERQVSGGGDTGRGETVQCVVEVLQAHPPAVNRTRSWSSHFPARVCSATHGEGGDPER